MNPRQANLVAAGVGFLLGAGAILGRLFWPYRRAQ